MLSVVTVTLLTSTSPGSLAGTSNALACRRMTIWSFASLTLSQWLWTVPKSTTSWSAVPLALLSETVMTGAPAAERLAPTETTWAEPATYCSSPLVVPLARISASRSVTFKCGLSPSGRVMVMS